MPVNEPSACMRRFG